MTRPLTERGWDRATAQEKGFESLPVAYSMEIDLLIRLQPPRLWEHEPRASWDLEEIRKEFRERLYANLPEVQPGQARGGHEEGEEVAATKANLQGVPQR